VGAYQPFVGLAGANAAQAGLSLPQRNIGDYMNPYIQNVVDVAKREAIRGDSVAQQGRNFAARQAGAFGGSRHGIVEAEAQRNLGQRLDDIQQTGLSQAYDKAMTAIDRESQNQTRSAMALGDLGSRATTLGYQDATALDAIGTRQQQQEQANLDTAYKDFLVQRDYDRDQVRFLSDIMNRAPQAAMNQSRTSETTQFTPQASPISQAAGLATAGLGAYGLGRWAFGSASGGEIKKGYSGGGPTSLSGYPIGPTDEADAGDDESRLARMTPRAAQNYINSINDAVKRSRLQSWLDTRTANRPATLSQADTAPVGDAPPPPRPVPRHEFLDTKENEAPRPVGTTSLSAVPPDLLTAPEPPAPAPRGLSIPEPPAPPAPSRTIMPPAFTTPDLVGEAQRGLAGTRTPAEARAAVKERDAELMKDPMEGLPRWVMPVLQAGLGMMQAKPGQSALSGIGAGAQAGIQEAVNMRKEGMERERENTRRKERAQDLTERERQAAAQDATAARQEVFSQAGLRAQQAGMDFNTWKAQLDTALQERRLTLEQYNASLNGYRAGLDAQRLKLEDRRIGNEERRATDLSDYYKRQGFVQGVDKDGNQVFTNPATGEKRVIEGVRPAGSVTAEINRERLRIQAANALTSRLREVERDFTLTPEQKITERARVKREIAAELGITPEDIPDTMQAGPTIPRGLPQR
jgi:hypothetical protein